MDCAVQLLSSPSRVSGRGFRGRWLPESPLLSQVLLRRARNFVLVLVLSFRGIGRCCSSRISSFRAWQPFALPLCLTLPPQFGDFFPPQRSCFSLAASCSFQISLGTLHANNRPLSVRKFFYAHPPCELNSAPASW